MRWYSATEARNAFVSRAFSKQAPEVARDNEEIAAIVKNVAVLGPLVCEVEYNTVSERTRLC